MEREEILGLITTMRKNLDKFNLDVAIFRVNNGWTNQLIPLYKKMGELSSLLNQLEGIVKLLFQIDEETYEHFMKMGGRIHDNRTTR